MVMVMVMVMLVWWCGGDGNLDCSSRYNISPYVGSTALQYILGFIAATSVMVLKLNKDPANDQ